MSNRYHINPTTGNPNICRATGARGCPFGSDEEHFTTKEGARKHSETKLQEAHGDHLQGAKSSTTTAPKKGRPAGISRKPNKEELYELASILRGTADVLGDISKTQKTLVESRSGGQGKDQQVEDSQEQEVLAKLPTSMNKEQAAAVKATAQALRKLSKGRYDVDAIWITYKRRQAVAAALNDVEAMRDNLQEYTRGVGRSFERYMSTASDTQAYDKLRKEVERHSEGLTTLHRNQKLHNAYEATAHEASFDEPVQLPNLKEFAGGVLKRFRRRSK